MVHPDNAINPYKKYKKPVKDTIIVPLLSIGISSGVNNNFGICGITTKVRILEKLFIEGGFGTGIYRTKFSIGYLISQNYFGGWSFGTDYTYNTGMNNIYMNASTKDGSTAVINFVPISTLTIKVQYNWKLGKSNSIAINAGYTFPSIADSWNTTSLLTKVGVGEVNALQPGGFMISFGFNFGIGNVRIIM